MRFRVPMLGMAPVAVVLALAGCGGGDSTTTGPAQAAGCEQVTQPTPKQANLKAPASKDQVSPSANLSAVVDTSCGSFTIALAARNWPKTVSSFVYMADEGLYDDTTFHRVVPEFVIQGGDPLGDGTGGPGYSVDEKPPIKTAYTRGVVAMAKTATEPPGRSGSQFFVVTIPDAGLPPEYAVLGTINSGQATVDRIESLGDPNSQAGTPLAPIVINSITIKGH